jgi:hypothetical protein
MKLPDRKSSIAGVETAPPTAKTHWKRCFAPTLSTGFSRRREQVRPQKSTISGPEALLSNLGVCVHKVFKTAPYPLPRRVLKWRGRAQAATDATPTDAPVKKGAAPRAGYRGLLTKAQSRPRVLLRNRGSSIAFPATLGPGRPPDLKMCDPLNKRAQDRG